MGEERVKWGLSRDGVIELDEFEGMRGRGLVLMREILGLGW
jgi:hypothetical protein